MDLEVQAVARRRAPEALRDPDELDVGGRRLRLCHG
jgi:hypothetical protein